MLYITRGVPNKAVEKKNIHYMLDRNNSVCFAVYVAVLTNSQVLRMHAEINLYAQVDVKAI